MSNRRSDRKEQPLHDWLPTVVLKFLVLLAFAFVLFEATVVGLGESTMTHERMWVIIAGMAMLLLLLVVERLTELRITTSGVEATLFQARAQALEEVSELEDQEAAEAARTQILQAESPAQVQEALAGAVELNVIRVVEQVKEAIRQKRKVYVRYRPDPQRPVEVYVAACLDVKPGKTPATQTKDYLWVYSYEHGHVLSLRLGRVLGIELGKETFDPAELMANWEKEPQWNVPRDW